MPATMDKVLKAKDVSIVVQPLARNEDTGALSASGSAFTVTGRAGQLTVARRKEVERMDADDATGADRDWTKDDFTLTVEALKLTTGNAGDLEDAFETSPFAEVQVRWPRAGVNRDRFYYGIIEEFSWDKAVGRNIDRISMSRIDIGASNPASASQL